MPSKLRKSLPKIAARILKYTWGLSPALNERLATVAYAYGAEAIEDDFTTWCESVKENPPTHPISEYLKIVDERLGGRPKPSAPLVLPEVARIQSHCYKLTNQIPNAKNVQAMLAEFSETEIIAGFDEYLKTRRRDQIPWVVKMFFLGGNGRIVMLARKDQQAAIVAEPSEITHDSGARGVDPAILASVTELVHNGKMGEALKILEPAVAQVIKTTTTEILNSDVVRQQVAANQAERVAARCRMSTYPKQRK